MPVGPSGIENTERSFRSIIVEGHYNINMLLSSDVTFSLAWLFVNV